MRRPGVVLNHTVLTLKILKLNHNFTAYSIGVCNIVSTLRTRLGVVRWFICMYLNVSFCVFVVYIYGAAQGVRPARYGLLLQFLFNLLITLGSSSLACSVHQMTAVSVSHDVIWCSLCQITLATCFSLIRCILSLELSSQFFLSAS